MNNLVYDSRDPQAVAPKVENLIRKELGAAGPIPYTVANDSPEMCTVTWALRGTPVGSQMQSIFQLNFELPPPQPARLDVSFYELGDGCVAGTTCYSARLPKSIGGEVALEPPEGFLRAAASTLNPNPYLTNTFTSPTKFAGNPEVSGRLNANGDLLTLANKLARTDAMFGGRGLRRDRLLKLVPDGQGCLLIVGSLPRAIALGLKATVDAKDFFELASLIERSL